MMQSAASIIQVLQRDLGIVVTPFYQFGLTITDNELSGDEIHTYDEVVALHDSIEEKKRQEAAYPDLDEAYNSRASCEYTRT